MQITKTFTHKQFGKVRTVLIADELWFVGQDVTLNLSYRNGTRDLKRHVDQQDIKAERVFDGKQHRKMLLINESGLYTLVLSSRLETAKKFKRWITATVIPSIRKHGGYVTEEKAKECEKDPDKAKEFMKAMKTMNKENNKLKSQVQELLPKGQYYDLMMDTNLLVNFRTVAKQIGVRPMYLIHFLLDKRYIFRNSQGGLLPYQTQIYNGLFEIVEFYNGGYKGLQTLITPKGRDHFLQLYLDGEMDLGK